MIDMDRLTALIDAYGADPKRWPADERAAGLLLLANSTEARAYAHDAEALDTLLDRVPLRPIVTVDPAAMAARIARVPAQRPVVKLWPPRARIGFFGWANFAALAAAGIVGFMVGWTDLNTVGTANTAFNRDIVDAIAPATVITSTTDESVW